MMLAWASESVAVRKLEPLGMTTRTGAPYGLPHAAAAQSASEPTARTSARRPARGRTSDGARVIGGPVVGRGGSRRSGRELERVLQQHRRRQRVDVALATARGAAHLAHGA